MRENWERRQLHIELDRETLTAMIQPVFPGQRVVSMEQLGGGLINTNYKFVVSGESGTFVLRLYAREPTRAICAKEKAIFELVHERVPVPEMLFADVEGTGFGRPYALLRWVEGVMLKEVLAQGNAEDASSAGLAVGETLAAIGSHTFPRAGFFENGLNVGQPISVEAYLGACLFDGKAGERLGDASTRRLWQMVTEGAPYFKAAEGKVGVASLVHSDFQSSNILMQQEAGVWKTAAVLDWEWAHAGSSLFDIGILLRHDLRLPPTFEPNFIASFAQHGGILPAEWKKMTKLYDLVNLCEFLNSPDRRGSMLDDVKALVLETIERWDSNELE